MRIKMKALLTVTVAAGLGASPAAATDFSGTYRGKTTFKSRPQPTMCPNGDIQLTVNGTTLSAHVPQSNSTYQGEISPDGSYSYSGRSMTGARISGSGTLTGKSGRGSILVETKFGNCTGSDSFRRS